MVNFTKINPNQFSTFHREVKIDTFDICARCGGKCESNKIASLIPGEAEYIASSSHHELDSFRNLYLDGIATEFGIIDVLKLKPGCPFLGTDYHCMANDYKAVFCEVYPVVFDVTDAIVQFSLDSWCPIVQNISEVSRQFEILAIAELKRLDVPLNWFRAVALYDHLCVDYLILQDIRRSDMNYRVFTLGEILSSQVDV